MYIVEQKEVYMNTSVNIGVTSESIFVINGVHNCIGICIVKTLELSEAVSNDENTFERQERMYISMKFVD